MITAEELRRMESELERLPVVIEDARRMVRRERMQRGLSVREAAAVMRVPATTLSRFEKGVGWPHLDTLTAVVRWIAGLSTKE